MERKYLITCKSDAIRMARAFCELDMDESGLIAELWQHVFSNNFMTNSFDEVLALGAMCANIARGIWYFKDGCIMTEKVISSDDVVALYGG